MQEMKRQPDCNNIETKRQAVEKLRGQKDESCMSMLLSAMKDVNWRVRKTAVEILSDDYPTEKYVNALIQLLYIEDNAGARNSAIEAFVRLGKKSTVYLIDTFRVSNNDVKKFIIDILGELMDPRALPLMLEAIKDSDENVRAAAVEYLGKTGEASIVDALIKILYEGELWTAYPAADALGRIGDIRAVPYLLEALKNKPMREPVLRALGLLADPSTLRHIIVLLEDSSRNIQEQALKTITKMYHNGVNPEIIANEFKKIFTDRAINLLVNNAWSDKHEVRTSAILLLGLMKDAAAYGPLLDLSREEEFSEDVKNAFEFIGRDNPESLLQLFDTDDTHQLRFICEVAGKINSPVYYDIFKQLLECKDGHVRSVAARNISKLNNPEVIEKIFRLFTDYYEDVQEAAVDSLINLKDSLKIDELKKMLRSDNYALKRNTACLLGKIKAENAVMDLGFALKDEDKRVRKAVVEALSLIGTKEAVKYLLFALTDEDSDIRTSAALSLGAIGGKGNLDSLTILTADPEVSVRVAAVKSLGMIKDIRIVPTLIQLLKDSNGFVVTASIESLMSIGGEDAKNAIIQMLYSDDEEIKRTAISALAPFENVEEKLIPFLRDPDWAARIATVNVLGKNVCGRIRTELEKLLDTEDDQAVIKAVEDRLCV